jgi:type III pantothenate kinase
MLLAIDSGNTNIVFAVFSDTGDLQGEWRAAAESNRTADEFGIWESIASSMRIIS